MELLMANGNAFLKVFQKPDRKYHDLRFKNLNELNIKENRHTK